MTATLNLSCGVTGNTSDFGSEESTFESWWDSIMKIIENISISLSLNRGKRDLLYETVDEILEHWKPDGGMFKLLQQCKGNKSIIGFVKSHTFDEEEGDFDFVQIYKGFSLIEDFKVLHKDLKYYQGFLISVASERDFRSKMMEVDRGDIEGLFRFEDY